MSEPPGGPTPYPGAPPPGEEGQPSYPGGQQPPPPPPPGSPSPPYPGEAGSAPAYPLTSPYPGQPPAYPGAGGPTGAYGGPPPAYPGGYGYGEQPQAQRGLSGFALAALLVAILLPLVGLFIAIPLAIVALVKIAKSAQTGKGLAIAGIIISVLWWIAFVVVVLFVAKDTAKRDSAGQISETGRIDFGDVRVGDCMQGDGIGQDNARLNTFDLKGVPCTDAHDAETAAIVDVPGGEYPGEDALKQQAKRSCPRLAMGYLGGADRSLSLFYLYPDDNIWGTDGGHHVLCFVVNANGSDLTQPLVP
ncbi:MAG: septum formation family protein [Nocardioidaceae bacterium]